MKTCVLTLGLLLQCSASAQPGVVTLPEQGFSALGYTILPNIVLHSSLEDLVNAYESKLTLLTHDLKSLEFQYDDLKSDYTQQLTIVQSVKKNNQRLLRELASCGIELINTNSSEKTCNCEENAPIYTSTVSNRVSFSEPPIYTSTVSDWLDYSEPLSFDWWSQFELLTLSFKSYLNNTYLRFDDYLYGNYDGLNLVQFLHAYFVYIGQAMYDHLVIILDRFLNIYTSQQLVIVLHTLIILVWGHAMMESLHISREIQTLSRVLHLSPPQQNENSCDTLIKLRLEAEMLDFSTLSHFAILSALERQEQREVQLKEDLIQAEAELNKISILIKWHEQAILDSSK